ncbi:MAG: hypothetical protein RMK18_10990 [Armatimonadota bacterium]|nr:hypothetical protein [Armatimonadota bacterium]MDW8026372.1 hypothetical protein [Armatimonadota bacterium]
MADSVLELMKLLREADEASIDAPSLASVVESLPRYRQLLSFGQTVCWDEPMKAVLIEQMVQHGINMPFIFGVHDTDYFSKAHSAMLRDGDFVIIGRNDGSTSNIWAATCETALPFGCEAAPTVSDYISCGIPLGNLARCSEEGILGFIDRWTEAWGWKAIVHNSRRGPVAAFICVGNVLPKVKELISWAASNAVEMVDMPLEAHRTAVAQLLRLINECANSVGMGAPLSKFYICLYRHILNKLIGWTPKNLLTTRSFDFFRFNSSSCMLERFKPLDIFLSLATREVAASAYNEAVANTGIYSLSEFGENAIPFDLVSRQLGRGTVCVDGNWLIVLTGADRRRVERKACEPLTNRISLARCVEEAFGDECALVGKAVITPTMLCSEGVMVLSETGSAYMHITKRFVRMLNEAGIKLELSPLLRICYSTFDAMRNLNAILRLPSHLARFVGSKVVSAEEFAGSWRNAISSANSIIEKMIAMPSPRATFKMFELGIGVGDGEIEHLRRRFEIVSSELSKFGREIETLVMECRQLAQEERNIIKQLMELQLQRSLLKSGSLCADEHEDTESERQSLVSAILALQGRLSELHHKRKEAVHRLKSLAYSEEAAKLRSIRHELYLKVFHERLSLARDALLTAAVPYSGFRPCAWWFCVLDTNGSWWRGIRELAKARLEEW